MTTDDKRTRYPKSVEEAVAALIENLSIKEKSQIAKMTQEDLPGLHFSLGLGIRNEFGLWAGNKDLLESCASLVGKEIIHPDDASALIMKELWKKLHETYVLRVVK